MPYIQHLLAGASISHYKLAEALRIGRSADNHIVLNDATVSAQHAVIEKTDSGYQIRDLDSTNGVFINGKRLALSELQFNDVIAIGTHNLRMVEQLPDELQQTVRIKKSWIPGIYYTDK